MAKIPIILITGFLGSGKTSFLNELLTHYDDEGLAVIVNELGQIALDQRILKPSIAYKDEQMLVLNSGCVCCNKRLDLIKGLKELLDSYDLKQKPLKKVIIETTGLANVAPIAFTLLSDAFLSNHFILQNTLVCVDTLNAHLHLQNQEAKDQIILADSIMLTKTDLKKADKSLMQELQILNPSASIFDKQDFNHQDIFSLDKKAKFQNFSPIKTHEEDFESLALEFDYSVNWSAFGIWLSMLLHRYGTQVLRVKGIIDIGEDFLVNINAVLHIIHTPTHIKKDEQTCSKLVFITRKLESQKIKQSLQSFETLLKNKDKI
ncbi:CobW family GTP-binding protein [Campylobacter sp. MIT 97-5078]|uniref:CobW family GTP-binding protein n=1 Tax=Campylobacter sp. MIT 97-5078 TaxID=1548153 RepID=UPI0005143564|nr:GTP-binding protein [Campylobacter sp. MIT 97-5078]KGI56106.1 ATP-binding protein [Campylobacter sp. MIT 97-5078]KGI57113.1 ATP-binding protein [Campylobacter sp. MIT 97-5078]TQR25468.1 GTP-binding protein [Campylobacter sp. MIT 97-5078]